MTLTTQEFKDLVTELNNIRRFYGVEKFNSELEKRTGIKAEPYIEYSYYDAYGDYLGDSNETGIEDIIRAAYIERR